MSLPSLLTRGSNQGDEAIDAQEDNYALILSGEKLQLLGNLVSEDAAFR